MKQLTSPDHGRPQEFFQGGETRNLAYLFLIIDAAMQIDVKKTLYPLYAPK